MDSDSKLQMIGAVVGLAVSVSFSVATVARAEIFEGYPDVIICRGANMRAVGYIDQVRDDGTTVYMTLGKSYGTVTPDHVFIAPAPRTAMGRPSNS
jgi:hypothetical protein